MLFEQSIQGRWMCVFGSEWNWYVQLDSVSSSCDLNRFCETCLCVHSPCKTNLCIYMQIKKTATFHISLSYCFCPVSQHLLFLYSSNMAGNINAFQFLSRALCVLANCKVFGKGKSLWLPPCCQWRNYYRTVTLEGYILLAGYFISQVSYL